MSRRATTDRSHLRIFEHTHLLAALTASLALLIIGEGTAAAGDIKAAAMTQKPPVGSLVIVGGGLMPDVVRDKFLALGGGEKTKLVVIPTASGKAEANRLQVLNSYRYWTAVEKAGKLKSLFFLHTRDESRANDPSFVKPLTEATAVWFTGGDQSLLMKAYKGTAVEREVKKLLARGGVVGGTSAGAAVMSGVMIKYGNPAPVLGPGFGLLDGVVVDQHFQERRRLKRLQAALEKHPELVGLGIDEQTGIVVQGLSATVVGRRNVRVCLPPSPMGKSEVKIFAAGDRIDLERYCRPFKISKNK
jgi:cyanophycinase